MTNKKPTESTAAMDQEWYRRFNELAAIHGVDGVTYARVIAEHHCSTTTFGQRLRRWKLIQASVEGSTGVPIGYADLQRQQFEQLKQLADRDLEQEKRAHQLTQAALDEARRQLDAAARQQKAKDLEGERAVQQLQQQLREQNAECQRLNQVLKAQTIELHDRKMAAEHQQQLITTLQAAAQASDTSLAESRRQLVSLQEDKKRLQLNEDRLNRLLDAARQQNKPIAAASERLPRTRTARRKPPASNREK